jgi:hypothetical protein
VPANETEVSEQVKRWYEHDQGERVGDLVLYRLKLKP